MGRHFFHGFQHPRIRVQETGCDLLDPEPEEEGPVLRRKLHADLAVYSVHLKSNSGGIEETTPKREENARPLIAHCNGLTERFEESMIDCSTAGTGLAACFAPAGMPRKPADVNFWTLRRKAYRLPTEPSSSTMVTAPEGRLLTSAPDHRSKTAREELSPCHHDIIEIPAREILNHVGDESKFDLDHPAKHLRRKSHRMDLPFR